MNQKEISDLANVMLSECFTLLQEKNKDYSIEEDALAGFKNVAKEIKVTPLKVWFVYARKHWGAISNYVRNNGKIESEPIESRLTDMINYCILLKALIEDEKKDSL